MAPKIKPVKIAPIKMPKVTSIKPNQPRIKTIIQGMEDASAMDYKSPGLPKAGKN